MSLRIMTLLRLTLLAWGLILTLLLLINGFLQSRPPELVLFRSLSILIIYLGVTALLAELIFFIVSLEESNANGEEFIDEQQQKNEIEQV